jgi:hypothetical protein
MTGLRQGGRAAGCELCIAVARGESLVMGVPWAQLVFF